MLATHFCTCWCVCVSLCEMHLCMGHREATTTPAVASAEFCLTAFKLFFPFTTESSLTKMCKCGFVLYQNNSPRTPKCFLAVNKGARLPSFWFSWLRLPVLYVWRVDGTLQSCRQKWKQRDWQHWEPQRDQPPSWAALFTPNYYDARVNTSTGADWKLESMLSSPVVKLWPNKLQLFCKQLLFSMSISTLM